MSDKTVRVPTGLHQQSRLFAATAGFWKRLGDIESSVLSDEIEDVSIEKPIYVTSLARAGTTILTELLECHPDVTSHRYSDFPNIWTPYWRNHLLQKSRQQEPGKTERAHHDRITISNDSPEAVEEVLWSYFFPDIHDESATQVLTAGTVNSDFEKFYQSHIRKLLAVRGVNRYLAKGNYNIARLEYLLKLNPSAIFVVPLRDPHGHIASLAKQHQLFMQSSEADPRIPKQLAMSGHMEFGPLRTFVNFGDQQASDAIASAWQTGNETEGWARYWAATYKHLEDQLSNNDALRRAVFLVTYDDLCSNSAEAIDGLLAHCELDPDVFGTERQEYIEALSPPDYYQPDFNADETALISELCGPIYQSLQKYSFNAV